MRVKRFFPGIAILGMLGPILLSACYPAQNPHNHPMAGHNQLSNAIRQADQYTQDAYRFALANPHILADVPCYCGCVALGHRNNLDCYIQFAGQGSEVVFDIHAVDCRVCVDITWEVMALIDAGLSKPEIYNRVEANFSRLGPGTLTGAGES